MTNTTNKPVDFGQTNANIQKTDAVPSFGIPKTTANDRLAQARQTASGVCEFCDKHGLAILPVRPGIMSTHSGAPELPADLRPGAASGAALPFSGPTRYTGRTVRSGYLYVYDERGSWDWYWITEYGYLMKLPKPGSPMNPAFTVGREPCDRTGHKEIASCITVKDPANAKRIWVAFSGAEWTQKVLELHQNEAYRKRHMREFDVKAWLSSHKAAHAKPIDAVGSIVAEYAPMTKVDTFAFSPYEFRSRASTRGALLEATKSRGPAPGVVLMLNDPVGVAAEIGARLAQLRLEFNSQGDRERKLSASLAILNFQKMAGKKARDDQLDNRDALDRDAHLMDGGTGKLTKWYDSIPDLREVTEQELQDAEEGAWPKYLADYDENARAQWHKQYLTDFDAYSERVLTPLAMAHSAWMESDLMADHFNQTHDETSAELGLVYVRQLSSCVQDTQLYAPCLDLYTRWIKGSYAEQSNLLLRGLALNLKAQRELFVKEVSPQVTWTTVGWDNLCGFFNGLADKALKHNSDVLPSFVLCIGGAITRLLQSAAGNAHVHHGLVALGTITERPVVPVELTGSFTRMRASVMRQLVKASGLRNVSENALEREVTYALRRLKIQKQPMNKAVSVRMMVMIDKETLKDMPARLSKAKQAQWAASALRTAEQVEAMNVAARERLIAEIPVTAAAAKMGAGVAKAVPVVGNLIAAYVQIAGIASTEQALGTASGLAEVENKARVAGSVSLLASTFADTADRVMQAMGITELSTGWSVYLRFIARWAPVGAKMFGVAGAVIGAVCDLGEMFHYLKENGALSAAYALSAIGGLLIAIAIVAVSLPIALLGALVYLIAQVLIAKLGDDKLDTWLKRCIWGKDVSNRYTSARQEMSEMPSLAGA